MLLGLIKQRLLHQFVCIQKKQVGPSSSSLPKAFLAAHMFLAVCVLCLCSQFCILMCIPALPVVCVYMCVCVLVEHFVVFVFLPVCV